MSVCFITTGPIEWASARYRAYWPAELLEDSHVVVAENGLALPDVDSYIFQKVVDIPAAYTLQEQGKRVIWDICDPIHWFSPDQARKMIDLSDVLVASNDGLADDLANWSGREVITIPDRLKISHYDKQRVHEEVDPIRFIWFGSAQNRETLMPGYIILERLQANGFNVEITVMDDRPNIPLRWGPSCPVYMIKWALENEVQVLANHDIAILPPYPGEWGKVKSDNKCLTAWACGLPVISGLDYQKAKRLTDSVGDRIGEAISAREYVEDNTDINKSAKEWGKILR